MAIRAASAVFFLIVIRQSPLQKLEKGTQRLAAQVRPVKDWSGLLTSISIGFGEAVFGRRLSVSGVIADLHGLLVILDGAVTFAGQIKQPGKIDVRPDFH